MNKSLRLLFNRYAGWSLVALFVAIPLLRWMQLNSLSEALNSTNYAYFSMMGRISALLGIVLYSINFLLATRLKFLESFFGGLNRVYIAHHIVGGLALIAVLIHPLALALRYVPDNMRVAAETLFPPLTGTIELDLAFGSIGLFGMALLLILTFFVKMPYGFWLFTHKFLGVAFLSAGLHVFLIESDTSNDTLLRYYILGWILVGLASFGYRTLLPKTFVRRQIYEVTKTKSPAHKVTEVTLTPKSGMIDYKPGQFIFVKFIQPGIADEYHPFSISSAAEDSKDITLTIKALGDFTTTIEDLREGTLAEIEGAFGRFTNTRYTQPRQIWIAGGIGVTPFISMARSLSKQQAKGVLKNNHDIHMFYVVRNASELIDEETLKQLSGADDIAFKYHPYLTDQKKELISAEYIQNETGTFDDADIFICGPPPMMKAMTENLMKLGVKKKYIHTEEFAIS